MRDELREAWRGLRAAPGNTLLAAAILTVGIAAATVTFSVVDTVALRRLPFPEPDRLLAVARTEAASSRLGTSAPQDFFTWQAQVPAFEQLAASGSWPLNLAIDGGTERLVGARVTSNLFDVLKVAPALGRGFTPEHEQAGNDKVVVISHDMWQRRFDADPAIVGRLLTFGTETREVIGVMPRGFTYPVGPAAPTDAYVPHVPRAADRDHGVGGRSYYLQIVGRVREGATTALAQEQVSAATANVVAAHPTQVFWKDARPVVLPLRDYVVGAAQRWLVLVLGAVVLVLVIAYVNVANLLLARATARSREFATRTALGASRARVARVLVIESLVLSIGAAAAGILLAAWGLDIAVASLPAGLARSSQIALDARVLTAAIAAAVATGMIFGVIPAWHGSRADVMSMMKQGGSAVGAGGGRARWQRALLVSELAFVVTLLVATALFVTSFVNVVRTDLGFTRGRLVGFGVSHALQKGTPELRRAAAEAFVNDALSRAAAVPGVVGAALLDGGLPLFGNVSSYSITVEGYGQTTGADSVAYRAVTRNYFDVAGIRFISGAPFDDAPAGSPPVVVINEEAARRFFKGRNPVGETITFRGPTRIVGVVSSVRMSGPEAELRPEMYLPILQHDVGSSTIYGDVVVRLAESPAGSVAAVQAALSPFGRTGQTPRDVDEQFRARTADRRFNAGLMTAFGALALIMAAAGVYGLMSFVVGQHTRVIGLRLAIGATAGRIFRDVVADAGRLLLLGLAIGLFGGWVASRLFASVVFGVTGSEAWLYGVVAGTVAVICLLAAIVPAWRASRVDPLVALRAE